MNLALLKLYSYEFKWAVERAIKREVLTIIDDSIVGLGWREKVEIIKNIVK